MKMQLNQLNYKILIRTELKTTRKKNKPLILSRRLCALEIFVLVSGSLLTSLLKSFFLVGLVLTDFTGLLGVIGDSGLEATSSSDDNFFANSSKSL